MDLLGNESLDLLCDSTYDDLLRFGILGGDQICPRLPPCKEYSRLKLRPGGPSAVRTPEHLGGLPSNTPAQQSRVISSQKLLYRSVCILQAVFSAGGHVSLEQPTNAMSWLEPFAQNLLSEFQARLVNIPACTAGQDRAKSWLFACSYTACGLAGRYPAVASSSMSSCNKAGSDSAPCQIPRIKANRDSYPAASCTRCFPVHKGRQSTRFHSALRKQYVPSFHTGLECEREPRHPCQAKDATPNRSSGWRRDPLTSRLIRCSQVSGPTKPGSIFDRNGKDGLWKSTSWLASKARSQMQQMNRFSMSQSMAAGIIQKILRRSVGLLGLGFRSHAGTALLLFRFGEV